MIAKYSDLVLILQAVQRLYETSVAPQMKYANFTKASEHIRQAYLDCNLEVVGDFAILFSVGTMWYSDEPMLFEELVIRFRKAVGNPVSDVVPVLDTLREQHGCVAVITGDAQRGLMAPVYLSAGFVPAGTQFYKGE